MNQRSNKTPKESSVVKRHKKCQKQRAVACSVCVCWQQESSSVAKLHGLTKIIDPERLLAFQTVLPTLRIQLRNRIPLQNTRNAKGDSYRQPFLCIQVQNNQSGRFEPRRGRVAASIAELQPKRFWACVYYDSEWKFDRRQRRGDDWRGAEGQLQLSTPLSCKASAVLLWFFVCFFFDQDREGVKRFGGFETKLFVHG